MSLESSAGAANPSNKKQANSFINKVLIFISRVAPNDKFSKQMSERRRRRKIAKQVHPELRVVWQNAGNIFPSQDDEEDAKEVPIVPKVDWSKVNSRMIKNIPDPFTFPVHGVSDDPEFYRVDEKAVKDGYTPSKFHLSCPFGYKWGRTSGDLSWQHSSPARARTPGRR